MENKFLLLKKVSVIAIIFYLSHFCNDCSSYYYYYTVKIKNSEFVEKYIIKNWDKKEGTLSVPAATKG